MSIQGDNPPSVGDPAGADITAYCFAGFRLSTRQQSLEQPGTGRAPIALTTKLYHLLLTFAARPGEIIDKDAVVAAVWPGQVVTDAALAKQIQRLREVLATGVHDGPLIETHRGRGYRFIGSVEYEHAAPDTLVTPADPAASPLSAPPTPERKPGRLPVRVAIATLTALAVLASVYWVNGDDVRPPMLALLPIVDEKTALSEGAAEYFASRLSGSADRAPALAMAESGERATQVGSLTVYQRRDGPVAAVQLGREGEIYRIWMSLRSDTISADASMSDESIPRLLERGSQWLAEQTGRDLGAAPTVNAFAITSYFEALTVSTCDQATAYLEAAIAGDAGFFPAQLRLLRCRLEQGRSIEVAASATALAAVARQSGNSGLALSAHVIAAQAHRELGDADQARAELARASVFAEEAVSAMQRMTGLAAIAELAVLNGTPEQARSAHQQRLALARSEYPLPAYLATVHLDIAGIGLADGDYDSMRRNAEQARQYAEDTGDAALLIRSYRFLITSYFRNNDMDAAVQLALAARPLLAKAGRGADSAYFMQFAAIALNGRGHLTEGREYTAQLRGIEASTANPMFGVLADTTVFHRLYAQGRYEEGYTFAAALRSRLETAGKRHSALPQALAFEALSASRGAPLEVAEAIIERIQFNYADLEALRPTTERARGHVLLRKGSIDAGLGALRAAEQQYRDTGIQSVADYVGYELVEARLEHEATAPWDDLERLIGDRAPNYQLAVLAARAHLRDGNSVAATAQLEQAKLRGHELWSANDELLLEHARAALATAEALP